MYRQLAAACLVLLLLAGALVYYQVGNQAGQPVAATAQQVAANANTQAAPAEASEPAKSSQTAAPAGAEAIASAQPATRTAKPLPAGSDSRVAGAAPARAATAETPKQEVQQPYLEQPGSTNPPAYAATGGTGEPAEAQEKVQQPAIPDTESARPKMQSVVVRQKLPEEQEVLLPKTIKELGEPQYKTLAAMPATDQKKEDALQQSLGKTAKKEQVVASAANSRWSVGMASGPSYFNQNIGLPDQMMPAVRYNSFATFGPQADVSTARNMEAAREEYDDNTDAAFSYGMEVRAGFRLTKKLKLLSGIGFIQNSARTKTSFIFRQFWFKPTTREPYELVSTIFMPSLTNGFSPDSIAVEQTSPFYVNYQYRQISVPLGLQYEGKIGNRGWRWYASGALAANFLTESRITTGSDKVPSFSYDNKEEVSPFRKVQFSTNIGMGVGKQISESVMIVAGPEFRSYLSSMLANPDQALAPQGKPYSIGVNLGVQYLLGQGEK